VPVSPPRKSSATRASSPTGCSDCSGTPRIVPRRRPVVNTLRPGTETLIYRRSRDANWDLTAAFVTPELVSGRAVLTGFPPAWLGILVWNSEPLLEGSVDDPRLLAQGMESIRRPVSRRLQAAYP
jgi:hypothetical protein